MGAHAACHSQQESAIGLMARFINLANKRRAYAVAPIGALAMATRTVFAKKCFATSAFPSYDRT
ncbi:hypothetical protein FMN63_15050 [Stappia sp. BW2]|uniref:hypothetical protein n=1 Tax=Stappia sp. BW2 TaxID=2592622 RepID=UPI0011DEDBA2|nr:hypothetical protein [Stappia sp. BW2]TYC67393.1 hypothetical protein FMN63_15050 [Stappia sp. BW2]